jgi:hypothetical protein
VALFHLHAEQTRVEGNGAIESRYRQHRVVDAKAEVLD